MKELAQQFCELFSGSEKAHGEFTITGSKGLKAAGKALTLLTPPTIELWDSHLKGKKGLGVIPIKSDNTCVWGVIDIDHYEDFDVTSLADKWSSKYPVVVCRSKSGGAHVFFFTTAPVPAKLMRSKLAMLAGAIGHPTAEIFPKQDTVNSQDIGNWLNMPYFDTNVTLRYGIREGRVLDADEFVEYATSRRLQPDVLRALEFYDDAEFIDAPPCIQYFTAEGFPEGSRNDALFSMGVFARKAFPDIWEKKVSEYNNRFMGPGSPEEVMGIIKGLRKTGYAYKCKQQPLCQHCNKDECDRRQHGIKKVVARNVSSPLDDVDRPVHKYIPPEGSGELAYWIFHIKGHKYKMDADKLEDQAAWISWHASTFDVKPPRLKADIWDSKLNELISDSIKHHQAEDETPEGLFWLYVKRYVTGNQTSTSPEAILRDKPYLETELDKVWVQVGPLYRYLIQHNFKHFRENEIGPLLKKRGEKRQKNIKGHCRQCYVIDAYTEVDDTPLPSPEEMPF